MTSMASQIQITEEHFKKLNIKCKFKFNIQNIGYVKHYKQNMLTYLDDKKYIENINRNKNIKVLIIDKRLKKSLLRKNIKTISVKHPKYEFLNIWNLISKERYKSRKTIIDKSALIHKSSYISDSNVIIGKNVIIHPNVTILADVNIGDNCTIHSGSVLGTAFINKKTSKGIKQFFHDGKLIIKNNVEILTNCSLDKGNSLNGNTIIGKNTKISHMCYIAHSSKIGEDCLLHGNLSVLGGSKIGNRVNINPGSTIGGWVKIGDDATIIVNSVVVSNVKANAKVSGHYAIDSKLFMKKYKDLFSSPFK